MCIININVFFLRTITHLHYKLSSYCLIVSTLSSLFVFALVKHRLQSSPYFIRLQLKTRLVPFVIRHPRFTCDSLVARCTFPFALTLTTKFILSLHACICVSIFYTTRIQSPGLISHFLNVIPRIGYPLRRSKEILSLSGISQKCLIARAIYTYHTIPDHTTPHHTTPHHTTPYHTTP